MSAMRMAMVAVVLGAGLTACGRSPAAPKAAGSAPKSLSQALPQAGLAPQLPGQLGAATGATALVPLLNQMSQAYKAVQGFSATIETYDVGPKGSGNTTVKVQFKRPQTLAIEVIKGADGVGARFLYTGGSDIKARPQFPPLTVTLPLTDSRIVSQNGWTLKQTGVGAIYEVLFDAAAQNRILGDAVVDGKPCQVIEVHSTKSPAGTSKELISIDKATFFPLQRQVFQGEKMVFNLGLKGLNPTTPPASAFQL